MLPQTPSERITQIGRPILYGDNNMVLNQSRNIAGSRLPAVSPIVSILFLNTPIELSHDVSLKRMYRVINLKYRILN